LYDSRNFTGASIYFEKALAIDPTDVMALEMMGNSLMDSDKPALAIEYYVKVLSLDPENSVKLSSICL
jgi:tetratricopeptide (TPR) repeat protein